MSLFALSGSLRLAPVLLLAALAGCGGNVVVAGGGAETDGAGSGAAESAGPDAFAVADAISTIFDFPETGRVGSVVVSDKEHLCDLYTEGATAPANDKVVEVAVLVWNPATNKWVEPKGPGSFPITDWDFANPLDHAAVNSYELDSTGAFPLDAPGVWAVSGMVTIVSATPEGAFAGNVDVVMNTGDTLQFDFDATPSCPALTKASNSGP